MNDEFIGNLILKKYINKAIESVKDKIGNINDTGGSETTGTVMGKLNHLIKKNADNSLNPSVTMNDVKANLNSTVGTSEFLPLDALIAKYISGGKPFVYNMPGGYSIDVPAGAKGMMVTACGAGGGGSGGSGDQWGNTSGGGGGAAVVSRFIDLTGMKKLQISVGSGGVGGVKATDGGYGSATRIDNILTLAGGAGADYRGAGGYSGGVGGGVGGSRVGGTGEAGITGEGGKPSSFYGDYKWVGSGGGGSLGNGGDGGGVGATSDIGDRSARSGVKGSGGGGAGGNNSGGNGGNGYVEIVWRWI